MFLSFNQYVPLQVNDRMVNMSMGALTLSAERDELYDITFPYFHGSLIFAIPSGKPYTSLEKLFFPFYKSVWFNLILLFTSATMIITWMKFLTKKKREFLIGKQNSSPFFNMIVVCFGGVMNPIPTRNFARTALLNWIVFAMIVRNAYQGTLFGFLNGEQRHRPLYTLTDIFEKSNVDIYLWTARFQEIYDAVPLIRKR